MKYNLVILFLPALFLHSQVNGFASKATRPFLEKSIGIDSIPVTIHGWIKGKAAGESLPGAIVQIKGTNDGTATDVNGEFTLLTHHGFPVPIIVAYSEYDSLFLEGHSGQTTG